MHNAHKPANAAVFCFKMFTNMFHLRWSTRPEQKLTAGNTTRCDGNHGHAKIFSVFPSTFSGMHLAFFGTGTSHGIPVIGCRCAVCRSDDPRDTRNRTGVWLRDDRHSVVIDVSGDFRQGALRHGLDRLDAVLLTHAHSDHTAGLDDLRIFSQMTGRPTVLYAAEDTYADLRKRFAY